MSTPPSRSRWVWQLLEPIHAVTYFDEDAHEAFERAGLRGFWRGYFAGRAAPLGETGSDVVAACFYGFQRDFVARAIPSIWSIVTPAEALAARRRGAVAALDRAIPDRTAERAMEVVTALRSALDAAEPRGRPLFAANAALPWPSDPVAALWHAATLIREHRGDGHVLALTNADVGPCDAHVLRLAADGSPPATIRPYRGWGEEDWLAAAERLRARGWIDDRGRLTPSGAFAKEDIEAATDRLAANVTDQLTDDQLQTLSEVLLPVVTELRDREIIPYPNPIGVTFPGTSAIRSEPISPVAGRTDPPQ